MRRKLNVKIPSKIQQHVGQCVFVNVKMATMSLAVRILDVQSIHTIQQGSLCLLSEDYCSTILQKQGAHLQLFHCRVTAVLLKLLVRFTLFKKKYLKQSRHIKQELETIWLTSHRVNFTCCSVVMLSPD